MQNFSVKELMVPLAEYATVDVDATLYDAVTALEKAQADFDHTRYRHRAVLALDAAGNVVGKLGQADVIKALEPKYAEMANSKGIHSFGFSKEFTLSLLKSYGMWSSPMTDLCRKAAQVKVRDAMRSLTEGEFVDEGATLDQAIHQMVMECLQSLLVTRDKKITGILRLTDVFAAIFHAMKQCKLENGDTTA